MSRECLRVAVLAGEPIHLADELRLPQRSGEIPGRSEPILRLLEVIHQVAGTGATVLILGQTGTGKELVARAIGLM
jgi:formate hydrogenlyase transcriptional activator